jgi:alpha-2-macroglobulin-like protein
MSAFNRFVLGCSLLTASCAGSGPPAKDLAEVPSNEMSAIDRQFAAMRPAAIQKDAKLAKMSVQIADYFKTHGTQRAYVMTDKPLYQPGETIWFRADLRMTSTLTAKGQQGLTAMLTSPRGAIVAQKRVQVTNGVAQNDFTLAEEIEGGEYTIALTADDGTSETKKVIVNTYEAPRLKKTLEFVRKAYGEGDSVSAAIEIKRATGEAFADKALTGVVTVDDIEVARVAIKTDKDGAATAKFQLPGKIARGDGLLTILADDGGVMESIQKRIPIVMKTMQLSLFPEGGDLVEGVPGRVYFMAKNTIGKPADIEGKVIDDRGHVVSTFKSIHDGLGRFEIAPSADRSYQVHITKPAGITQTFELPAPKSGGCVLRSVEGAKAGTMRVGAICSSSRTLLVEAVLREQRVAAAAIAVEAGKPALIEMPLEKQVQGAMRVTLFSSKQEPLAERLVYMGKGADLKITMTADRPKYSPRDAVKLKIQTTDASGKPVKANVGVAVVDDTVLSYADDKSGRIQSKLYLEPELGVTAEDPIEEPNFYFGTKPEAAAAMDALLATRGYRTFEWQPVFAPPPPVSETTALYEGRGMGGGGWDMAPQAAPPMAVAEEAPADPVARNEKDNAQQPRRQVKVGGAKRPAPAQAVAVAKPIGGDMQKAEKKKMEERPRGPMAGAAMGRARLADKMDRDDEWGGEAADERMVAGWSPVRVFPVPQYTKAYDGPRTDFRETIYWNASVDTGADGTASVTFPVSDAVTSFRATAEGVSAGGLPGAGDVVIQSKMPLSLDARLPVEVTSGDEIRLPVTLTNETDDAIDADLSATFGSAFKLSSNPSGRIHLRAGEKTSLFFPLKVVATDGEGNVALSVKARGLDDTLEKKIRVVPLGFPFEVGASGTVKTGVRASHSFELGGALPGSIKATVTMYPSPVASMTKGMEAMIREPGGCFEQTSSSNYPNIMVLSYLATNDAADAALVQKTQGTLDRGYKLLTGYETKQKGYEWFGQTPGHEALTAYGLMEFADMAKVYEVDHSMVERTADWLMSRRDGKGGFLRSSQALDSFGRANEATTNAYIMWALAEAKRTKGMEAELSVSKKLGESTKDAYLMSLVANTALLVGMPEAKSFTSKLVELQDKDGSFPGAKESITMSGGESLAIETTALATLALLKASPNNEYEPQIRKAVDWLNAKRGGFGQWSNTQATILGLKAMTAYSEYAKQMATSGAATLLINGQPAGTINFEKGRKDALVWDDISSKLTSGTNKIEIELAGGAVLPYSIALEYRAARPQSSANAKVNVTTQLAKDTVKLGEGVKLRARVENKTAEGQPMTLARVGIPGGLTFQTWQLKELRDKGLIDFYETRPREVILYWRSLAPSAKKDVDIDLIAATPGTFEAPATSAYLYYTAEDKAWVAPVKVSVEK